MVSAVSDPPWEPGVCAAQLAPAALMMIVATHDHLVDTAVAISAFDRAAEPKELVVIDGHHFSPYEGAGFDLASSATTRFFTTHL